MEVPISGTGLENGAPELPQRPVLATIVHVDMVGYSLLVGMDVTGTLLRLRELRTNLINPLIRQYFGHLVQTAGDSLLLTFDSVSTAVNFAVTLQKRRVGCRDDC